MTEARKLQLPDLFENPPRRGVSENDVWRAADALLLEGRRPTIEAVRRYLGGGSPNTVTPYLDTWYKGLGKRLQDPRAFAAPAGIPEPVAAAAAHFWESALAVARGELTAERDALALAQRRLIEEQEALQAESKRMAAAEVALNEALTLAKEQLSNAVERGDRLVKRNDALEADMRDIKAQLQAARDELEVERRDRAADAKQALETLAVERERFEANERRWMLETDRARETAKVANAALETAREQLATERRATQLERDGWHAQRSKTEAELGEARAKAVAAATDADASRRARDEALARLTTLETRIAEATKAHEEIVKQFNAQVEMALRAVGRSWGVKVLQKGPATS